MSSIEEKVYCIYRGYVYLGSIVKSNRKKTSFWIKLDDEDINDLSVKNTILLNPRNIFSTENEAYKELTRRELNQEKI